MNFAIATYISEQLTDEVQEALIRSYRVLLGDITTIRLDSPLRRSRLSSSDSSKQGTSDISIPDNSHHSDHSPMVSTIFIISFSISFVIFKYLLFKMLGKIK